MDMQDIKAERTILEGKIIKLVNEFEKTTDCKIAHIIVMPRDLFIGTGTIVGPRVVVKLDI